jgi:hypothetical protein
VLVNNAGVMPIARFLDEPTNIGATTINVTIWGPINGIRLALPAMIERGRGHVVNIASLAGKQNLPGLAGYCASKHAGPRQLPRPHQPASPQPALINDQPWNDSRNEPAGCRPNPGSHLRSRHDRGLGKPHRPAHLR